MKSNITLIFEKGINEELRNYIPKMEVETVELEKIIPKSYIREDLPIPNVPEIEIIRHYIKLSQNNYGVDLGIYPLGSCTMKYNPKINETVGNLPGFSQCHPLQEENQGSVEIMYQISKLLGEITGMDGWIVQLQLSK